MKQKNGSRAVTVQSILLIVYIVLLVVMFFSTQTYFGTENYNLIYRISVVVILLFTGIMVVYKKGIIPYNRKKNFIYSLYLVPYLYLAIVSFIEEILAGNFQFDQFIVYSIRPILICLMAVLCYSIFKERLVHATVVASVINYGIYIATCISKYGLFSLLDAGSDNAASRLLEVHEITFVFGLFFLYFWMTKKEQYKKMARQKKCLLIIMLLMSLLGFKRILCLGLAVSVLLYLLLSKSRGKGVIFSSYCIILFCFLWCAFCSIPFLLEGVSAALNIDLKGRDVIYSCFLPYYSFGVSYIGHGIGYVQNLIYEIKTMFWNNHYLGLHNEILRLYIDIGFIPYLVYLISILPINVTRINRKIGNKAALIYFIFWFLTLSCSTSDNLLTYPNYMLVFMVIGIHALVEEDKKNKLMEINKK